MLLVIVFSKKDEDFVGEEELLVVEGVGVGEDVEAGVVAESAAGDSFVVDGGIEGGGAAEGVPHHVDVVLVDADVGGGEEVGEFGVVEEVVQGFGGGVVADMELFGSELFVD